MYERIREILLIHRGKENPITARQISRIMGFPLEDTQSVSRKAIWETAVRYDLALASCSKGYFIVNHQNELDEYNNNIQRRIDGMIQTRNLVNENFRRINQ